MKKLVILLVVAFALTLAACGGGSSKIEYPLAYDNGTVTSVETVGETTVIHVEVKGYAPIKIKVAVTFNNAGSITEYVVSSHMETPVPGGSVINSETFIPSLVENQSDLSKVDVVAGATETSQALIDAAEIAKLHFSKLK